MSSGILGLFSGQNNFQDDFKCQVFTFVKIPTLLKIHFAFIEDSEILLFQFMVRLIQMDINFLITIATKRH